MLFLLCVSRRRACKVIRGVKRFLWTGSFEISEFSLSTCLLMSLRLDACNVYKQLVGADIPSSDGLHSGYPYTSKADQYIIFI
jgi:hypothetical protein